MPMSLPTMIACALGTLIGYLVGHSDGAAFGRERERVEQAARQTEHDDIMRKVGVCKWAKIMAEDIRCKQELP